MSFCTLFAIKINSEAQEEHVHRKFYHKVFFILDDELKKSLNGEKLRENRDWLMVKCLYVCHRTVA